MRSLVLSSMMVFLLAGAATAADTVITITGGTWSEQYTGGGPGQPGNVVNATITGTDGANAWTISLPSAVLSSFNGGSGAAADPYDTDYTVSAPPATMTDGSRILMFSSLTLNNQTVTDSPPQSFEMTTSGTCDAGCYAMCLTVTGVETAACATDHGGDITGGTITLTLLKDFEGNWCETFGPGGQGSAGGTLTASLSGSGWEIDLPKAIHQGVVSGAGTPGDPWVTHYEVDPNFPATIKYGPTVCYISSLTLVNENVSGVPLFYLTASGVCDAGCYEIDLDICGTVDVYSITPSGMCGYACGDGCLTLLKDFDGTWCETFGPCGPGTPGGTLTANLCGSGWEIDLPKAIHQGVISGTGTPDDPWVSLYEVDPNFPATIKYGSTVCYVSSMTLVNENVSNPPTFQMTANGICDGGCYEIDLSICGAVDKCTITGDGMCGSACGEGSLTLLKTFDGTWCETFGPDGPGSPGGTLTASLCGSGWEIDLPKAIHRGVISGSGTPDDPWVSLYEVDPNFPATIKYGSTVCYVSSMTLVNRNISDPPTFQMTANGVCDGGCYEIDLDICGAVDKCTITGDGMCGSACGDGSLTLLKAFDGTWCETFGPDGPGSPGGTLTASLSGSGWTIELPNAIHQGVIGGAGTPDDPWISYYEVDPTQPAVVQYGSTVCYFSSLTLVNQNVDGVPMFQLTAVGTCDAGCYELELTACGAVDLSTVDSSGMCGSVCGEASLSLLRMFEGTWCETFGPEGQGSPGGTLTASLMGAGWEIELPNAIHQGVIDGNGTPDDPWVSLYLVDPCQPATVEIDDATIKFSSLTLVNRNVAGMPVFELTVFGKDDNDCLRLNLTASGAVDPTSVTGDGMCGSVCGEATLKASVNISSSAGGEVTLPGEGCFLIDYGTWIDLEVQVAGPLFEFVGWRGSYFSGSSPDMLPVLGCHHIRAKFVSLLDVIYVDDDAANDPGPCNPAVSDWREDGTAEHPFDSVQEAIEVAADGATVVVLAGKYREDLVIEDKSITVTSVDPNGPASPQFPVIRGRGRGTAVTISQHSGTPDGHVPQFVGLILTGGDDLLAGGISVSNSSPVFRNCVIVGHRGRFDGSAAMLCEDSNPVLVNCTLADNLGLYGALGGICCINSHLTVGNSILWNNQPAEIVLDDDSTAAVTFSNVQGGFDGEGNFDEDPLFVAPGSWVDPAVPEGFWINGDYHVELGSPCVDAGDDSDASAEPAPNGDRINIGAYGGTDQATVSE